jgi:tRNA A-37 threonylcarbamoyl transferase component Bud32
MSTRLRWRHDRLALHEHIEAALANPDRSELVATSRQRTLLRVAGRHESDHLLKLFHLRSGPHPWREAAKFHLGVAAPQREWRALGALASLGVRAPTPLGLARLQGGDALIVSSFVEGPTLHALLRADPAGRREDLAALADVVRGLHAAGWAHGDLHPGNVIAGPDGPVLIDWQRARACRPGSQRQIEDLGRLDHSLATLDVPAETRAFVLERTLGSEQQGAQALRAVRARSRRIRRRHARRRAREQAVERPGGQPSSGNSRHSPSPTRS